MKRRTLTYVAGPYTIGDSALNVHNMVKAADRIAAKGYGVFIPLLNHFWHIISPRINDDFWKEQDNSVLSRCDCLVRLPGESLGADEEMDYAKRCNIPVFNELELYKNMPTEIKNEEV